MTIWYTVPEIWCVIDVIIFHFGLFFALLSPTSPKNQNFEKMKKSLEILSFYICVPKTMIRWCTVPEIWCVTDVIIFHFGLFFALLKKWKKGMEISSFYTCVPKIMIRWCTVPEICCATDGWMDGLTDGRKKWHIEVGAPPKIVSIWENDTCC